MKTVCCLRDLEEFGIYPLTGEACGLMMRVLCDFSERGREVLARRFGIEKFQGSEQWNSRTGNDHHVGSIMLCRDDYLDVGVFGLIMAGYKWVYRVQYREPPLWTIDKLNKALKQLLVVSAGVSADDETSRARLTDAMKVAEDAFTQSPNTSGTGYLISPDTLYAFTQGEEAEAVRWQELVKREGYSFRTYAGTGTAQDGFRNQHVFTGRVE